jgi:hypothetical protein
VAAIAGQLEFDFGTCLLADLFEFAFDSFPCIPYFRTGFFQRISQKQINKKNQNQQTVPETYIPSHFVIPPKELWVCMHLKFATAFKIAQ